MRELAAFIANCDLFVGNSNGPSHVATSTEIPSLQLHGPTYAKSWSPLNERHQAVQKAQMEDIDVESVWHALGQLRPVVEKRVQYRLQNGVRIEWDDPMAF
jgi:ADP-heptose:LPS heptosyltransferase